ncbi:MAG: hypothetical protein N3B11_00070 [Coriobacteriia bacterium]|nr:hypothetical protein [Coriobacteriia bacterium]
MGRWKVVRVLAAFVVGVGFVWAATAYASPDTYIEWTAQGANAGTADTPHLDYRTTTRKCAVCHAVHFAGWYQTDDGTPDGSMTTGVAVPGSPSELLLRGSVADSCTYCHIETAIGGIVLYGGDKDLYLNEDDHGHQAAGGATCTRCHAVHGSGVFKFAGGTFSYFGFRVEKSLKASAIRSDVASDFAGGDVQRLIEATATLTTPNGDRWEQGPYVVIAFCTQCHPMWAMNSEDTVVSVEGSTTTFLKTHPIRSRENEVYGSPPYPFSAQGASSGVTQVAGYEVGDCVWWCHTFNSSMADLGPGVHLDNFPHYNSRSKKFVYADTYDVPDPSVDGMCLQSGCHRWSDGSATRGVGIDF